MIVAFRLENKNRNLTNFREFLKMPHIGARFRYHGRGHSIRRSPAGIIDKIAAAVGAQFLLNPPNDSEVRDTVKGVRECPTRSCYAAGRLNTVIGRILCHLCTRGCGLWYLVVQL